MKKSEFWCYGKNEALNICPICNKPIYSGAIMVERWHAECFEKSPVIMQRWIPVTERMPKEYEIVMVCTDAEEIFIADYLGLMDDGEHCFDDNNGMMCEGEVIAWMPLPEPYKEEGE